MKKAALCVVLAALTGAIPSAAQDREARQKLVAIFSDARAKYLAKDYSRAIELFKEYNDRLPRKEGVVDISRSRAHYSIAASYIALGDSGKALNHLERSVEYGLWNPVILERDRTLEPIRRNRRFSAVLEKARNAVAGMAFGLKDLDGKFLRRKDYEGKVLILDVWGTWCPPCRMEIPHFVDLQAKYRDQGLRIVGITYEKRDPSEALRLSVKRFADVMEMNYPCVLVGREHIVSIPDMRSYPTTFFIDRNGVVRERLVGAQSYPTLERVALRLLKEKKKKVEKK